jgi:hypothetical protein
LKDERRVKLYIDYFKIIYYELIKGNMIEEIILNFNGDLGYYGVLMGILAILKILMGTSGINPFP